MEILAQILAWLQSDQALMIIMVLFGISEALALIPQVKANSVFQAVVSILSFAISKLKKPELPK